MNLTNEPIQVQSIALDWFQANLKGKIEKGENDYLEQGNFTLIFEPYGSKHFTHRARVINNGIEFGEIKFSPRSEIMHPNTVMFKANNQVLYEKNFFDYCEEFFQTFSLSFSHLAQIDMAADGSGFLKPLILADNLKIEWTGKGDFQPFKKNRKAGLEYEGFWLGSKSSDKFGRAYYKRRELLKSGKTYIEHFWRENNLFEKVGTTDIERLEFSLKNKELAKWIPRESWKATKKLLQDHNFIARLFHSASKTLFTFRENRKNSKQNVSRLRKLFSLDFSLFGEVTLLDKIVNVGAKRLRALKTTAKTMYELSLKTGIKYYKKQCIEIAQNINHFKWYEKCRLLWEAEFRRDKKKNLPYIPLFDTGMNCYDTREQVDFYSKNKQYVLTEEPTMIEKLISFWRQPQYQF